MEEGITYAKDHMERLATSLARRETQIATIMRNG